MKQHIESDLGSDLLDGASVASNSGSEASQPETREAVEECVEASAPIADPGSRRSLLVRSGLAALGGFGALNWSARASAAPAAVSSGQHTLVILYLRGGCDGLSIVAPRLAGGGADVFYETQRLSPNNVQLAIAAPGQPNGGSPLKDPAGVDIPWMLAPAAASALSMYDSGALAFIHGCGSPVLQNGSHFFSQDYMEDGTQISTSVASDGRGWAGRAMGLGVSSSLLRGFGWGKFLQRTLFGAPKTVAVPDPTNYNLGGVSASEALRRLAIEYLYNVSDEPLRSTAANSLATLAEINAAGIFTKPTTASYPNTPFGTQLMRLQQLIQASADPNIALNLETVMLDYGDWDNHISLGAQSTTSGGGMFYRVQDVFTAIAAFHQDLQTHAPTANYTFVAMTEFGRRITANGDDGVDHGRGSLMWVFGPPGTVHGRNVYTMLPVAGGGQGTTPGWNGLQAHSELQDGAPNSYNVISNIDYRRVVGEIVQKRLMLTGSQISTSVFPNYPYGSAPQFAALDLLV
ncbi:MAG: DUF1501 domain-containing protein [Planctomycetes bacterium]|nr:DUF1501 domain-containing protein [Planctomycetota bacterium]